MNTSRTSHRTVKRTSQRRPQRVVTHSLAHHPSKLFTLSLGCLLMLQAMNAWAVADGTLPVNGQVVVGTGTQISTSGKTMSIDGKGTANVAINWDSFSVGKDATVNFTNMNAVLNNVTGSTKSEIAGAINGENVKVFLVNPNGIEVQKGAEINVGNLHLSTRKLDDAAIQGFATSGTLEGLSAEDAKKLTKDVVNLGNLKANTLTVEGNRVILGADTIGKMAGDTLQTDMRDKLTVRTHDLTETVEGRNGPITIKAPQFIIHQHVEEKNGIVNIGKENDQGQNDRMVKAKDYGAAGTPLNFTNINLNDSQQSINASFPIDNVYDLQNMEANKGGNYYLTKDIDASETTSWNYRTAFDYQIPNGAYSWKSEHFNGGNQGFKPVGSVDRFTGVLDGAGHKISGLMINRPEINNVGLLGFGRGVQIRHIGLEGSQVIGSSGVGALLGNSYGNSVIYDTYATGEVHGEVYWIGGLVGDGRDSGMTIARSYTTTDVSGRTDQGGTVGGLVGDNWGNIIYTYAAGNVSGRSVGGLLGNHAGNNRGWAILGGKVSNSYATGNVNGFAWNNGGLVGNVSDAIIDDSYAVGLVKHDGSVVNQLIGRDSGGNSLNNLYSAVYDSKNTLLGYKAVSGGGTFDTSSPIDVKTFNQQFKEGMKGNATALANWAFYNKHIPQLTGWGTPVFVSATTSSDLHLTYNGKDQSQGIIFSNLDAPEGSGITEKSINNKVTVKNAGTYSLADVMTFTLPALSEGYKFVLDNATDSNASLIVDKAPLKIKANGSEGITYGHPKRDFGVSLDGLVDEDANKALKDLEGYDGQSDTIAYSTEAWKNRGTIAEPVWGTNNVSTEGYAITIDTEHSHIRELTNYNVSFDNNNPNKIVITPAIIKVKAKSDSITYGATNAKDTIKSWYTLDGDPVNGDQDFGFSSATQSVAYNTDGVLFNGDGGKYTNNVGDNYSITLTGLTGFEAPNYTFVIDDNNKEATLKIIPKEITISTTLGGASSQTYTYGDSEGRYAYGYTVADGQLANGDEATVLEGGDYTNQAFNNGVYNGVKKTNNADETSYSLMYALPIGSNYKLASRGHSWATSTVQARELRVKTTVSDKDTASIVYGTAESIGSYGVSYLTDYAPVYEETVTGEHENTAYKNSDGTQTKDVGSNYALKYNLSDLSSNYTFSAENSQFAKVSVTPYQGEIIVTPTISTGASYVYGSQENKGDYGIQLTGTLVNDDTLLWTPTADQFNNTAFKDSTHTQNVAGNYQLSVSGNTNANYGNVRYQPLTVSVTAAPLTVETSFTGSSGTAAGKYTYGDTEDSGVYKVTLSGLTNDDTFTPDSSRFTNSAFTDGKTNVAGGTYALSYDLSGNAWKDNYTITPTRAIPTVAKKALTVTLNPVSGTAYEVNYGASTAPSVNVSMSGFAYDEENSLSDTVKNSLSYRSTAFATHDFTSGGNLTVNSGRYTNDVGKYNLAVSTNASSNSALNNYDVTVTDLANGIEIKPVALTVKATDFGIMYGQSAAPAYAVDNPTGLANGDTWDTVKGNLNISYSSEGWIGGTSRNTNNVKEGGYAITPSIAYKAGQPQNYTITAQNGTLIINKALAKVKAGSAFAITYGDQNAAQTVGSHYVIDANQLVNGDSGFGATGSVVYNTNGGITGNASGRTTGDAGSYTITLNNVNGLSSTNYRFEVDSANNTAKLAITPKTITVATYFGEAGSGSNTKTYTYGDTATGAYSVEVLNNGLTNGDTLAALGSGTYTNGAFRTIDTTDARNNRTQNAGTTEYDLSYTLADSVKNYVLAGTGNTWAKAKVTKATATVTPNAIETIYGTAPVFGYSLSGLKYGETQASVKELSGEVDYSTEGWDAVAEHTNNVGQYSITASGHGTRPLEAKNYSFVYQSLANGLTINPATLTIKSVSTDTTYGQTPAFTYAVAGMANGESETDVRGLLNVGYSYNGVIASGATTADVGTYTITPSAAYKQGVARNYTLTVPSAGQGTLTINPVALVVRTSLANAGVYTYGDAEDKSVYRVAFDGLVNGDETRITPQVAKFVNTAFTQGRTNNAGGKYVLTYVLGEEGKNYLITPEFAAVSVQPKEIVITPTPAEVNYGSTNTPSFGFEHTPLAYDETWDTSNSTMNPDGTVSVGSGSGSGSGGGSQAEGSSGIRGTVTFSSDGWVGNTSGNGRYTGATGEYTVDTDIDQLSATNYRFTLPKTGSGIETGTGSSSSTLTVKPVEIVLVPNPATVTMGTGVPTLTGSVYGLVNGDTLADFGGLYFDVPEMNGNKPGSYAIKGHLGNAQWQQNYRIVDVVRDDKGNVIAGSVAPIVLEVKGLNAEQTSRLESIYQYIDRENRIRVKPLIHFEEPLQEEEAIKIKVAEPPVLLQTAR